ncbi:response regulator [Candidatus Riflebacteria bacterium]
MQKKRKRILIVDDEQVNIKVYSVILQKDYEVKGVLDGLIALEVIPEFRPDLILLDIMMPGLNGYETCKRIRKNPISKFTKILMVSGKITEADRLKGYEVGSDDYIVKPFVKDELLAKIKVYLQLKREEEFKKLKTDLLTLISHETRTPLSVASGYSQIIMGMEEFPPEKIKNLAKKIFTSCTQLSQLIDQSVRLSELKDQRELQLTTISLNYLFKAALQKYHNTDHEKEIEIREEFDSELYILGNEQLLIEAIMHIMLKVVDCCEEGKIVKVSSLAASDYNKLIVTIPGPVPATWLDEDIFSDFLSKDVQHHKSFKDFSLPIAKRISQLNYGDFNVAMSGGEDASFIFLLPATGAPAK